MNEITKLAGRIILIAETQIFPNFQKREFVIETADKYPQNVKFEATKEGCDRLDAYQVGDEIIVSYNIRGNEYNGKYYVSLTAWRIERAGGGQEPTKRNPNQNGATPPAQTQDEDEEIPF
jgi:single-strand DNA-binding protein